MTATGKVSVAATGTGVGAQLLGELAGLTAQGWAVLAFVVVLSVAAGALARQGHYEANHAKDDGQVRKSRRYAVMIVAAQILGGFCAAAGASGNIWLTIPACLAIGWTGARFLNELEKRMGGGK